MNNKILFLILAICLYSCKSKPIITDRDVNHSGGTAERIRYDYKEKLSKNEITYFSEKLGVSKQDIDNEKLYAFIKSWEETTYLFGGIDKNGVDCSALMQHLFEHVYDMQLPRTSGEMYNDKRFKQIKEGQAYEEGDLVFFKIDEDKVVSHVGIYLKNNKFFSASSTEGCSISSLKKNYWKKYFVGASRLKKQND